MLLYESIASATPFDTTPSSDSFSTLFLVAKRKAACSPVSPNCLRKAVPTILFTYPFAVILAPCFAPRYNTPPVPKVAELANAVAPISTKAGVNVVATSIPIPNLSPYI